MHSSAKAIDDPDASLYGGGFFSGSDKRKMELIRSAEPDHLKTMSIPFDDQRLPEMLFRYRARNWPESLSEEETKSVIKEVYKNQKMLIDPHTAVAIGVVNKISLEGNTVILATAHPSKFSDVVMEETSIKPELPENLKNILVEKEKYEKLPKDLKKIQNYIMERI